MIIDKKSTNAAYCFCTRRRIVGEDQKYKVSVLKGGCLALEIQMTYEQEGFLLAEWLLHPETNMSADACSFPHPIVPPLI